MPRQSGSSECSTRPAELRNEGRVRAMSRRCARVEFQRILSELRRTAMKTALIYTTAAMVVLLSPVTMQSQNNPAPASSEGFVTQGSVTAGYRFVDTCGRRAKYLELFDLRKGFRLNEFDLFGRSPDKTNNYVDTYSLNASGLGGDPFPGGQFAASKQGLYDLRVNYRQT